FFLCRLLLSFFFFSLSLHDALPIYSAYTTEICGAERLVIKCPIWLQNFAQIASGELSSTPFFINKIGHFFSSISIFVLVDEEWRSEEHTSEHQSRFDLVCRLLLEKK